MALHEVHDINRTSSISIRERREGYVVRLSFQTGPQALIQEHECGVEMGRCTLPEMNLFRILALETGEKSE
jgi:hypothetical protein